ncbi:MAG TPA: tetratricopeptide repeat protein [Gemmataceae bacterium]|nr:tetratricopeptide repeat protein [Gemmataceae bacterium]
MARRLVFLLSMLAGLLGGSTLRAQNPLPEDKPRPLPELPLSPAERQRQEAEKIATNARKLFAFGLLLQHQDQLLEAIRKLEECLKLDPDAVAPRKTLASLYIMVGRTTDALAAAKRVVELAPQDADGWQRYADVLKSQGINQEAIGALQKKLACPSLEKEPEQLVRTQRQLAGLQEKVADFAGAEATWRRYLQELEKHRAEFEKTDYVNAEDYRQLRADAFERIGQACSHTKRLTEARQAFTEAYMIHQERPNDSVERAQAARIHYLLAEALANSNEPIPAMEHLQYYLKLRPASAQPYQLLITVLKQMDKEREIVPALQRYWEQDRTNANLQLLLAAQYAAERRYAEARELYLKLVEREPRVEYYRGLYKVYFAQNDVYKALEQLDKQMEVLDDPKQTEEARTNAGRHAKAIMAALREDVQMVKSLLPLALDQTPQKHRNGLRYRTFHQLATLAASVDDLDAAAQFYRAALKNLGYGWRTASSDFYLRLGLIDVLEAQHKWEEIQQVCDEFINRRDDRRPGAGVDAFWFRFYKGQALAKLGQFDEALAEADQAIVGALADSSSYPLRAGKVSILLQAGRFHEALDECNKILKEFEKSPDYRRARILLAEIYSAQRDYTRAEHIYRAILEVDPNDAQINNSLGYQLADQNRNLEEAEKLIRRAIELDRAEKGNPAQAVERWEYLDSLGWVEFRRGRLEEARASLEKAVHLPGGRNDGTAWNHLGDVYFQLGDSLRAHDAWQKALSWMKKEDFRAKNDGRLEELERKMRIAK